jgi:uncharacterized protein YecE (DUF72 family)
MPLERGGEVLVGVSGWSYPRWRGDLYPEGLPHADELRFVTERLGCIELNASFYSLRKPENYQAWRSASAPGSVIAIKGGRFVTHVRRLRGARTALANFFASGVLALGESLGPVLWQLPPNLRFDPAQLDSFLGELPRTRAAAAELAREHNDAVRGRTWTGPIVDGPLHHVLEVRHPSFLARELSDVVGRHDVAVAATDGPAAWPSLLQPSSTLAYLRLHGPERLYAGGYPAGRLLPWVEALATWAAEGRSCFAFFNNDSDGRAPYDALTVRRMLTAAGARTWQR